MISEYLNFKDARTYLSIKSPNALKNTLMQVYQFQLWVNLKRLENPLLMSS